jgi:dTDP-4-dehydrorhamnose reductase
MNELFSYEKTILVTGSGGQLGMEIWKLSEQYPSYKFLFTTREDLPIEDFKFVKNFFVRHQIDFCINCGIYCCG